MSAITLPNGWAPREYQLPAWSYLERGGTRAYLVWHRRAGKDDLALHWAAVAAHKRPGNYWHMLPQAAQSRKAIWDAINPHTGKRRIDEAFPPELRETTRENEMLIKLRVGSTWQLVGSDNYDSLVGSPPIGVTFSEWALSKPSAWAYLRPILAENGGWAAFITTPRGRNHAARMFDSMRLEPGAFVQKLTARQTGVFSEDRLSAELSAYINEHGDAAGRALFDQEYLCSFESANLGAIYAPEIATMREQGRIGRVPFDPKLPVLTGWDIGYGDATAIWFAQMTAGELRLIDYYEANHEPASHYAAVLRQRAYQYETCWLPHDADNGQSASGNSFGEVIAKAGFHVRIAPKLDPVDGINATRMMLRICSIDETKCRAGIEALEQYHWKFNTRMDQMGFEAEHDWSSHGADALRYLAVSVNPSRALTQAKPLKYRSLGAA